MSAAPALSETQCPLPDEHSLWRVAALSMMDRPTLQQSLAGPDGLAWIEAAAACGIVEAQLKLAQALLDGEDLPPDARKAFGWISRAAASGNAEALNMLGRCYENGWGTGKSFARAAVCFHNAAQMGNVWAQYNLGHLLLDGLGVEQNRVEAFRWYSQAAAQGHARAMNLVARCLEMGWGVSQDRATARNWYRLSAEGGYFRGQFNYAMILAEEGAVSDAVSFACLAFSGASEQTRSNMRQALKRHSRRELRALASNE